MANVFQTSFKTSDYMKTMVLKIPSNREQDHKRITYIYIKNEFCEKCYIRYTMTD